MSESVHLKSCLWHIFIFWKEFTCGKPAKGKNVWWSCGYMNTSFIVRVCNSTLQEIYLSYFPTEMNNPQKVPKTWLDIKQIPFRNTGKKWKVSESFLGWEKSCCPKLNCSFKGMAKMLLLRGFTYSIPWDQSKSSLKPSLPSHDGGTAMNCT